MTRWIFSAAALLLLAAAEAALPQENTTVAGSLEQTFVDAIARSERSVAAIARVRRRHEGELFQLELHQDAFGRRTLPPTPPSPTDPDFIPNECGSGVVIGRGLILTTSQILADGSDYFVTTADRKTYKASVHAADPRSGLAVLAIDAADLPTIAFGDGDAVKKGQIVLSLGNPRAIARDGQASASHGIIANLHRKTPSYANDGGALDRAALYAYGSLIQTDAKLTLGAAGGPLLNLRGEMIGLVISFPAAPGQEPESGYAIPVDAAFRRAVEILKQGREVEYGFLGIQPATLTQQELLEGLQGVRVSQIVPGTPAARSRLRAGDIIVSVNGEPLFDSDGLILHVGRLSADAVAHLRIVRDGVPQTVDVRLSKFAVHGQKIVTVIDPPWRGLRVEYLTAVPDDKGQFRTLPDVDDAVVITDVVENSPAAVAGLRRGMLITQVDRTSVRTPKEFAAAVAGISGDVELHVAGDAKTPIRVVKPAG